MAGFFGRRLSLVHSGNTVITSVPCVPTRRKESTWDNWDMAPPQMIDTKKDMENGAMTSLEHLSELKIGMKPQSLRKTGIICTIGPSCSSEEALKELLLNGMNIARLNFSHGTHEQHAEVIKTIRKLAWEIGDPTAIALDTKGPEIRTGMLAAGAEIELVKGKEILLTTNKTYEFSGTSTCLYVDYRELARSLKPGSTVFIDDGLIALRVQECEADDVLCIVENGGMLGNRKGVNLPGVRCNLPAVTEKDRQDILFAVEQELDIIFASFIRNAEGIKTIRKILGKKGEDILIIAKIESEEGVLNAEGIIQEADGVMVARGDLGIEIPPEKVFVAQKMLGAKCNLAGKPVICATQMLESMVTNARPTRAECTDVANAVLDGFDCVMLSGETAKGQHPVLALQMMHNLCKQAESAFYHANYFDELMVNTKKVTDMTETIALSAVSAVIASKASAIILITHSGDSAQKCSRYKPPVPIISVCRSKRVARQLHLYRCVFPVFYKGRPSDSESWHKSVDNRIEFGVLQALNRKIVRRGDTVVIVRGSHQGSGHTNMINLLTVP